MVGEIPYLDESLVAREALGRASVLYTDLDGTLLARGGCVLADADGEPSTRVAEAIVAARRAGVTIVPVSGRGRIQLIELTRLLGWRDFIAEAGGVTVRETASGTETIFNIGEWDESVLEPGRSPYEIIEATGALERLAQSFPGRIEYHTPWHDNREITHVLRGCVDAAEAQLVLDALTPPIDFVDNGIIRSRGDLDCEGHPHAYHLVPRGVTKSGAIAADLDARGLGPADAVAIGDSASDLEASTAVSTLVLVDNAFDSAGVLAGIEVTDPCNVVRTRGRRGDGWAEFMAVWVGP
jgi:hydroxymethylpyrimidine pyrophosphatase-like HAD family hydrolase